MSIQITVLHDEHLFGAAARGPAANPRPKFVPVAVVTFTGAVTDVDEALELAWQATNSIDQPWERVWKLASTTYIRKVDVVGSRHRSTSMGDRMRVAVDGVTTTYEAAIVGFDKVEG